jgi:hypothetical protein
MNARTKTSRFRKLIRHLSRVPGPYYNQGAWFRANSEPEISRALKLVAAGRLDAAFNECGAAACLCGHAALALPSLLVIKHPRGTHVANVDVVSRATGRTDDAAFGEVFDLCQSCAYHLTNSLAPHRTPAAAAATMTRVLAGLPWDCRPDRSRVSNPRHCHAGVDNCVNAAEAEVNALPLAQ